MRTATKTDILQALAVLDALPKQRGTSADAIAMAYERAFVGKVDAGHLSQAVDRLLLSQKYFPSPSEVFEEIQHIAEREIAHETRARRLKWEEDQRYTEGMDDAAKARADALWQRIKPTLKHMPTEEDPIPEPEPVPSLTEAERLERIRQCGHEPTQPTDALLRSLSNPMNPDRG